MMAEYGPFERLLADDHVRWMILFVCVGLSYAYVVYQAFVQAHRDPEAQSLAYLLNPAAGGYRTVRGDLSSPSLFQWDAWEYAMFTLGGLFTVWLFYALVWQNARGTPWYVRVVEFLLAWTHSVVLLAFLPANAFHRRLLYNLRAALVEVVNHPLKELWLAFLFIVLLPLPGSRSHTERLTWLALKLGTFYIAQSLLLGSPHYTIEPATDNRVLPESGRTQLGYGALIAVVVLIVLREQWPQWRARRWATLDANQRRTRLWATIICVAFLAGIITIGVWVHRQERTPTADDALQE